MVRTVDRSCGHAREGQRTACSFCYVYSYRLTRFTLWVSFMIYGSLTLMVYRSKYHRQTPTLAVRVSVRAYSVCEGESPVLGLLNTLFLPSCIFAERAACGALSSMRSSLCRDKTEHIYVFVNLHDRSRHNRYWGTRARHGSSAKVTYTMAQLELVVGHAPPRLILKTIPVAIRPVLGFQLALHIRRRLPRMVAYGLVDPGVE